MLKVFVKLKNFIWKMSLKSKLVTIFVILTTIPLSVVGIVSFSQASSIIERKTIESTTQIAEQLNQSISLTLQMGERFTKIIRDESVIKFLTTPSEMKHTKYESAKEIIKLFKLYRDTFEDYQWIRGIYIIGFNGNNICEAQGVYSLHKDINTISTINKIIEKPKELHIIPNSEIDYARKMKYEEVISLGKTIEIPTTNQIIGVIIIDIDKEAIEELCENITIGEKGYFSIITYEGDRVITIYNSDLHHNSNGLRKESLDRIANEQHGHFIERVNGSKEFIVFNTLSNVGWKILGRVELNDLMSSAYTIRRITIFVVLLSIIFTAILYIFISEQLTRPIRNIKEKMKQAERGVFVEAECNNRDEIGDLYRSFNKMIKNIMQLIEDKQKEQKALQKAELKALQAQINPHFLYNTLDAIVWMTETNNNDKVVEITKAFSSFFRITLSKGNEWITLAEEIEHTRSYLIIQRMRYRDILSYEIDVDDSILKCRILKLILQPIVENALYHGIKNKRNPGSIIVRASRYGDEKILLEVIDDGNGMTEERLREVVAHINADNSVSRKNEGYGLRNVNQRIKLYYGKQYGLFIKSEYKKGTHVSVIIPLVGDENV